MTIQRIEYLFLQFASIYPYRWNGQFTNKQSIQIATEQWFQALKDLSLSLVEKGLMRCQKEGGDFPPSIPQFRKYCLPTRDDIGILSADDAYNAYYSKDYSNPLVAMCSRHIDRFNFNHLWEKDARKLFKDVYKSCLEQYEQTEMKKLIRKEGIKKILNQTGNYLPS